MMMKIRRYPFTGWVLTRSFTPKEVTFVKGHFSFWKESYEVTDTNSRYKANQIFLDKASALNHAIATLVTMQKRVNRSQENLNRKARAIKKALT